jgi:hypothetical protein
MVMFSFSNTDFSDAIHSGLPSPVSINSRFAPEPTIYVFVPGQVSKKHCVLDVAVRTLQSKLAICQQRQSWVTIAPH